MKHRLNRFRRAALVVSLVLAVAAGLSGCAALGDLFLVMPRNIPVGDYTKAIEYADQRIRNVMRELDLPSVAVALVDDQSVVWHEAYGVADVSTSAAATVDTVYKIGSIAKVFTGLEVMRLVEDGLVDLDAPVETYLPGAFPAERWPDSSDITVRSILAHRSGLPRNDTLPSYYWDAAPDVLGRKVETLSELRQAFNPGERYKYSNLAYNVLGRLIEVERGLDVPALGAMCILPYYMESEFFIPLGMGSTGLGSRDLLYGEPDNNPVAMGYYLVDGRHEPHPQYDIVELASGNAQSTLTDMERFAQFILAGGVTANSERVIDATNLESMYEPQYTRDRDPQTNGLTWFTDDIQLSERVVFHSGGNQGFTAMLALAPASKVGIVLLCNSEAFEDEQNAVVFELLGLMIQTKTGVQPPEPARQPSVDVTPDVLQAFTGTYIASGEPIQVSVSRDRLRATYQERTVTLRPIARNRFELNVPFVDLGDMEMGFFVGDSAEPDLMILTVGGSYHIICPRYPATTDAAATAAAGDATAGAPPELWQAITGTYTTELRHPSAYGNDSGSVDISVQDGVLFTSDGKALVPEDETAIRIVGGVFDGEVMERDPATGNLVWQEMLWRKE